jgi:hypothetical protein
VCGGSPNETHKGKPYSSARPAFMRRSMQLSLDS